MSFFEDDEIDHDPEQSEIEENEELEEEEDEMQELEIDESGHMRGGRYSYEEDEE